MKKTYSSPYKTFYYESFEFSHRRKRLTMRFSLDKKIYFSEEIKFDFKFVRDYSEAALINALKGLYLMSGVYYYSLYLSPNIVIQPFKINKEQADFFNKIFLNGLGELLYVNSIDPSVVAKFPYHKGDKFSPATSTPNLNKSLVLQGGGKDSVVSIEILKQAKLDFYLLRSNPSKWSKKQAKIADCKLLSLKSHEFKTYPKVMPTETTWGHIPFSAILAFRSVCVAILAGSQYIIASNESSANEGNVLYKNMEINHQYSKTINFEIDFQSYIKRFVTPSVSYFSLLRPLSELKITELFADLAWIKYKNNFCSCNDSEIDIKQKEPKWCGKCAKCVGVYALLIAFIPKSEVETELFNGKDLLKDRKLRDVWLALLGIEKIKPFECVATADEIRSALHLASVKNGIAIPKEFGRIIDSGTWKRHTKSSIPVKYKEIINKI